MDARRADEDPQCAGAAMPRSGKATSGRGRGAGMKKALGWILLILVIFYISTQPGDAADIARGIGDGLAEVFRNLGTFVRELTT
jgi:hypothetical protein